MLSELRSRFSKGYFTVGHFRQIPIRFHIATPIGLFVFSSFSLAPAAWAAVVIIILVHELGHAAIVRGYDLRVVSIDVNAIGGLCRGVGYTTDLQESVIAWGGVLAQGVLLALTNGLARVVQPQTGTQFDHFWRVLTTSNVFMIAINLLPVPPLDGSSAWRLFRWRNFRSAFSIGRTSMRSAQIRKELRRLESVDRCASSDPKDHLH